MLLFLCLAVHFVLLLSTKEYSESRCQKNLAKKLTKNYGQHVQGLLEVLDID